MRRPQRFHVSAHWDGTTTMQMFKFNVGTRSVERAVADAIGQGISQAIASRREKEESVPQRFAELIAHLDDAHREQSDALARLQPRKGSEE
jgi:hypothetical protein